MDYDEQYRGEMVTGFAMLALLIGGGVYYIYECNKKIKCSSCGESSRNKNLVVIEKQDIDYSLPPDHRKLQEIIQWKIAKWQGNKICIDCANKITSVDCYVCEKNSLPVRESEKTNFDELYWPREFVLSDILIQERNKYSNKWICTKCMEKVKYRICSMYEIEVDPYRVCCPRCNDRFLLEQLFIPRIHLTKLPSYWIMEKYSDAKVCENCIDKILEYEVKRYEHAKIESKKIKKYSCDFDGIDKIIDHSTARNNVKSGDYRNWDDAYNELKLRAFNQGFDVIFNCEKQNYVETDGNYKYKMWSVTCSLAKRKRKKYGAKDQRYIRQT